MTEEFKPGDRVVLEGTVKSLSAEGHYVFVKIDPDSDDPEWGWFPLSGLRHAPVREDAERIAELESERYRLAQQLIVASDYSLVLMKATEGQSFDCQLCSATKDEEHKSGCPLVVACQNLIELLEAATPQPDFKDLARRLLEFVRFDSEFCCCCGERTWHPFFGLHEDNCCIAEAQFLFAEPAEGSITSNDPHRQHGNLTGEPTEGET